VSSAALLLIDLQTDAGITGRSYLFGVRQAQPRADREAGRGDGRDDQG
jgi:hypothetical protein